MTHMKHRLTSGIAKRALAVCVGTLVLAGCHQDMWNQPKYRGLRGSTFFEDGKSARELVPGTVQYREEQDDDGYYTGKVNGEYIGLPDRLQLTPELLARGQQRYNIYCTPCHGYRGDGMGYIVTRGMPRPTNYHTDTLRQRPEGYFVDVITNGFGMMYSYASRVPIEDRWAIAAYIRALQLSQFATMADLSTVDPGTADPAAVIDAKIREQLEAHQHEEQETSHESH